MSSITPEDYKELSQNLKLSLGIKKNPVSIKLFQSKDEAAEILPKFDDKVRHCRMINIVATEGRSFYSTLDEMACNVGAAVLGLQDVKLKVEHSEPDKEAVGYAPLEDAPFDVDAIVLYCNVMQAYEFTTTYRKATGNRINADFAGTQALCSEAVIIPSHNNRPNISFGCMGSRNDGKLEPDELVIGLTLDDAKAISDYVNTMNEI